MNSLGGSFTLMVFSRYLSLEAVNGIQDLLTSDHLRLSTVCLTRFIQVTIDGNVYRDLGMTIYISFDNIFRLQI